jgi:hypothetical protein
MKKVKWSCVLFALSLLTGCSSGVSTPSKKAEPDGIFGVDLTQKDYQLIQAWDTLGGDAEISIDNLYQSAVGFSDGRLLFEFGNGYTHQYFFAVLTPKQEPILAEE